MDRLCHILFANSRRLQLPSYLFEYEGTQFKLVQSDSNMHADCILTIVPDNDPEPRKIAYRRASKFASALGWSHGARVDLWPGGESSARQNLLNAEPRVKDTNPFYGLGMITGYTLYKILNIKNDEQRLALSLFREANASNNAELSFLLYWQILEIKGCKAPNVLDCIAQNGPRRYKPNAVDSNHLVRNGKTLGFCMQEDWRDAIAHIKRRPPTRKSFDRDELEEQMRVRVCQRIAKSAAEYYIKEHLGLKDDDDCYLYLVRRSVGEFPVFVDFQKYCASNDWQIAYPKRAHNSQLIGH